MLQRRQLDDLHISYYQLHHGMLLQIAHLGVVGLRHPHGRLLLPHGQCTRQLAQHVHASATTSPATAALPATTTTTTTASGASDQQEVPRAGRVGRGGGAEHGVGLLPCGLHHACCDGEAALPGAQCAEKGGVVIGRQRLQTVGGVNIRGGMCV